MARQKKDKDGSTEEKIKEAARKLFTERGYDAVKTRDIAAEAGINLALLNYYFRGKENLYEMVMLDNMQQFIRGIVIPILGDEKLSVEEILAKTAAGYIDMLLANPHLPLFIMHAIKRDPGQFPIPTDNIAQVRAAFLKRFEEVMKGHKSEVNMAHFMMNFMGLVIFPFIAKPILMKVNGLTEKDFNALMEERKKLVPQWLITTMKSK
jgi:AcrR family transcriptional regulator